MPIILNIDNKYKFDLEIIQENNILQKKDAELFEDIIKIASEIKQINTNFTIFQEKIIGQNRINYVSSLDKLFIHLTALQIHTQESFHTDFTETGYDFKVPIFYKKQRIFSKGLLDEEKPIDLDTFDRMFDSMIILKIKELLVKFKEFITMDQKDCKDNLLSLYISFDDILYNILTVRQNIEYI